METQEEFFDTYETLEQLSISMLVGSPQPLRIFNSEPSIQKQDSSERFECISEYKTDFCLPNTKTTLFSWTSKNLTKKKNKDIKEFSGLEIIQEITLGPPHLKNWVLKFSPDSNYLALAGESSKIFVFSVSKHCTEKNSDLFEPPEEYSGHRESIVNISWNMDSDFFLSCSFDSLVLLWKIGHTIPIKQFIHSQIVSCMGFYPCDGNIFYTASLDKKVYFWDLLENKIQNTYQTQGIITAGAYSPNGLLFVLGLSNGECIIYEVHNAVLTFLTQIHCRNKAGFKSSGKNVTGIEFQDDQYLLITTKDSRIRLYNLNDFRLMQKYKGGTAENLPIRGTFSHNFIHVIRGSEDGNVFIWNTFKAEKRKKWTIARNDEKNSSIEFFRLNKAKGNSDAVFAPAGILNRVQKDYIESGSEIIISHIVLATSGGKLYVLYNQFKNVPW